MIAVFLVFDSTRDPLLKYYTETQEMDPLSHSSVKFWSKFKMCYNLVSQNEKYYDESGTVKPGVTIPKPWTSNDIELLAHMILMVSTKNFNGDKNQIDDFIKKQLYGACCAMKYNLNSTYISNFRADNFLEISRCLNFYNMLKKVIFLGIRGALNQNLASHAMKMLRWTHMTVFGFIDEYLVKPTLTAAFTNADFLNQIHIFFCVKDKIIENYGNDICYFKLLNPHNTCTALKNFPDLAHVATWHKYQANPASMRNFKLNVPLRNPRIKTLVCWRLKKTDA